MEPALIQSSRKSGQNNNDKKYQSDNRKKHPHTSDKETLT